ncbi:hypothetical protein SCOCK_70245 [Actinacidiphila cocklensis]|uniref:Uncharacterized protein n=1 Tax=Actinacidiphila cocklensis TaxID=887465 RepID=A0A9W4GVS0_9ACTN|nr:hypothetical protein SCOCK_70245 [Actinacidiphila cocklensis]
MAQQLGQSRGGDDHDPADGEAAEGLDVVRLHLELHLPGHPEAPVHRRHRHHRPGGRHGRQDRGRPLPLSTPPQCPRRPRPSDTTPARAGAAAFPRGRRLGPVVVRCTWETNMREGRMFCPWAVTRSPRGMPPRQDRLQAAQRREGYHGHQENRPYGTGACARHRGSGTRGLRAVGCFRHLGLRARRVLRPHDLQRRPDAD